MKKNSLTLLVVLCMFLGSVRAQTPAFPGAEGGGMYTTGGRGGTVYYVNTLEDTSTGNTSTKEGSLRWCINQKGARTILFKVSGTIYLTSQLKISNDNLTIAGQSAPGNGICIAEYPFVVAANNVIIRYLRFRPGDGSGEEPDGLGGMDRSNIIIDHCSVSWSVDECLSIYGMENLTVQWCLASEALRVSTHGKGTHCYGGNWGGNKATYHHNMIAHCESRTPRLGPRPSTQTTEFVDIRNNVFYNWAGEGCYGGEGMNVNLVNNYYKPGPATDQASAKTKYRIAKIGVRTESYVTSNPSFAPMKHIWGKFYIDGNKIDGNDAVTADNWTKGVYEQQSNGSGVDNLWTATTMDTIRLQSPLEFAQISTHTADQAYETVLNYVGSSLYRDEVDQRIVSDVRNRAASFTASGNKSGYINTPSDTKPSGASDDWSPWPALNQVGTIEDSDRDGIPDGWLAANYPGKNATDLNEEGYTYLEVYLNSLVAHITQAQSEGAVSGIETEFNDVSKNRPIVYAGIIGDDLIIKSNEKIKTVHLYSVSGNLIKSLNVDTTDVSVGIWGLQTGVFIIKTVLDNSQVAVSRIIR